MDDTSLIDSDILTLQEMEWILKIKARSESSHIDYNQK